jgi:uncharacterized protein (TIGR02246 family)
MRELSMTVVTFVLTFGLIGHAAQQPAGGQPPQSAGQQPAAAKEETAAIAKVRDRYTELYNKGDAAGLAQLFAPDAVSISPQGQIARGRSEIEKAFREEFAGPAKGARVQIKSEGTRTIGQNTAVDYGTYQISGMQAPASKQPAGQAQPGQAQPGQAQTAKAQATVRGHYLVVLSRAQQQWMIEALHGAPEPQQMAPGQAPPR